MLATARHTLDSRAAAKMPARKRLYWERRAAERCVDCDSDLTATDGVRCLACNTNDIARQLKYKKTEKGRTADLRGKRKTKALRVSAKQCTKCGRPSDKRVQCGGCRRTRRMRRAGVLPASSTPLRRVPRYARMPLLRAKHRVLTPPSQHEVPPGWTLEADRREELLALSELVAMRKIG